ncbi:hypothetical protein GW17_00019461 [Ensete ventricosum]|nr:hypothetical protein GW17_00019461 [Ensete ventricosum]
MPSTIPLSSVVDLTFANLAVDSTIITLYRRSHIYCRHPYCSQDMVLRHLKDLNIRDLESYAMTSEDLIDVKLEAFETRIEDKLHALFAEFKLD